MTYYGPLAPPATLGERITSVRTALRLTLQDVADSVGVSAPAVFYWENDSVIPRPQRLEAVAAALYLTVPELLGAHSHLQA